jgi:signal transduction histidine kinase
MMPRMAYRTRLTLAYTAIVAVAVLLLGTIAFAAVRLALESAFATRLDTTVKTIRSIIDIKHGRMEKLHGEDLVQVQALLGDGLNGAVLWRDGSLMTSNLSAPPAVLLASLPVPKAFGDSLRNDRGATIYVTYDITEGSRRYGTIVAWGSREVYDDAERIAVLALGGAGLVVILAAALAGGSLARRMLRPVTELSGLMSAIEATDLGERSQWAGPDDELGRLCRTFDRLLDRLEAAFERERRFIADASHELRTPLSAMRAEVELALMHDRSPEAYRAALQRLRRETQRLEALAQRLILTSRDEGEALTLARVLPRDVVARAIEQMQPLAHSAGITLGTDGDGSGIIEGDADMLERAIVALIDNALRFAADRITVGVTGDDTHVAIEVRDDGPGFSTGALHDATDRFWRDDPARTGSGTGLGLAIVRAIVERHHGKLMLQNAAGAGGTVVMTFPAVGHVFGVTS